MILIPYLFDRILWVSYEKIIINIWMFYKLWISTCLICLPLSSEDIYMLSLLPLTLFSLILIKNISSINFGYFYFHPLLHHCSSLMRSTLTSQPLLCYHYIPRTTHTSKLNRKTLRLLSVFLQNCHSFGSLLSTS